MGRWLLGGVLCSILCVWPSLARAAITFDSSLEGGTIAADGWTVKTDPGYTNGVWPGVLDISTDQALSGTHSLKGTYLYLSADNVPQPSITHYFTPSQHFFARFGYRTSSGFQIGSNNYTKIVRFRSDAGVPIYWIQNTGGSYGLTIEVPWERCDGSYEFITGVAPSSSAWDQVELEVLSNTPGQSNGQVRMWINNVQYPLIPILGAAILNANPLALALIGPTPSSTCYGWPLPSTLLYDQMTFYIQSGLGQTYADRIAMGTTRIGPTGTSVDTTPPAVPTGFAVH